MTEPARRLLQETETFKLLIKRVDAEGFKKEVAKIAFADPQNAELKEAILVIAAEEFGDAGKQTARQVWEEVQTASRHMEAHTQVAIARAHGLYGFQHSKSPTGVVQSYENALIAVEELGVDCRYDLFHDKVIVKGYDFGMWSGNALENLDNVVLKIRQAILLKFGFDPGKTYVLDALLTNALDHAFNPVRDYLDSLRWDGAPRLDRWMLTYCGAPDTPLNHAIGRKMLIGGVRRVRQPGCKFDYITVLESVIQGVGKSTLLRTLAGEENFSDAEILGLDKQEQQEAVQGVWIYEIGELQGLSKAEVEKVKMFASKTHDMARPAYGRTRLDRARQCIFVATTNQDRYLRDPTGNRRFWPVKTPVIDLEGIARDRDQLWAEAAAMEALGEPLVIHSDLWPSATVEQIARMEIDPWEEQVGADLLEKERSYSTIDHKFILATGKGGAREFRVSISYLLSDVLRIPPERQHQNHASRLAVVMRNLGWLRSDKVLRIAGAVCRGYTKPFSARVTAPAQVTGLPSIPAARSVAREGEKGQKTDLKCVTGVTKQYRRF
jgi:predicted P-loop ATPase